MVSLTRLSFHSSVVKRVPYYVLYLYHLVFSHEPINVSLADLRAADKRGKWWLVGSAWAGDPLAERERMRKQLNPAQRGKTPQHAQSVLPTEDSLFLLAKTQGMNTEVRKSIFVVLMSSDVSALSMLSRS
jgi:nucleolar MIF4G domain-containing protein 1